MHGGYASRMNTGLWAAVGAALCWTLSATAFTEAGRRIGSVPVNLLRLLMASLFLGLALLFIPGMSTGGLRAADNWLWFGISGAAGFFLADLCLFRSFLDIGPRRSLLTLSLSPPVSALIGAMWLGEWLGWMQWLGMAVTLAGVIWGVMESDRMELPPGGSEARRGRGIALAAMGMLAQSVSMVISKRGIASGLSPVEATMIRVCAGIACFIVFILATRQLGRVVAGSRNARAMGIIIVGAMAGPALGVGLMMRSLVDVPTGVAQTVLATTPVLIIPFAALLHRERVTLIRLAASLMALAGVAMLFLA